MYNKLFISLQHSVGVVYFYIIIWYTFTLSFTVCFSIIKRNSPKCIRSTNRRVALWNFQYIEARAAINRHLPASLTRLK